MSNRFTLQAASVLLMSVCLPTGAFGDSPGAGETLVAGEASVDFVSRFHPYGLAATDEPILLPFARVAFLDDLLSLSTLWYMDVGTFSRQVPSYGRQNLAGRYWELDANATLARVFTSREVEALPTSVGLSLGYTYEYHPRAVRDRTADHNTNPDTQFVLARVWLPDVWFEPLVFVERDFIRDNGTYVNLQVGHEFALGEARVGSAAQLGLDVRLGQGFGDARRVKGYLADARGEPLDHAGAMDTSVTLTLVWRLTDWLSLRPYASYYDYLLDSRTRGGARRFLPRQTGTSGTKPAWQFVGGVALSAEF